MIAVSEKWRKAQLESILPESFVEITYDVTEPGLQNSASESNNGAMNYSDHEAILDVPYKDFRLYATLEHNMWGLDGEHEVLPDEAPYGATGFVSESFVDGKVPIVAISFDSVHDQAIPGITITWSSEYGEYATRFEISAYNGNDLVFSQTFQNTEVKTTCEFSLAGYSEIRITVLEWSLPNRRARIERVFLGIANTYTKADLISFSHSQFGDVLSAELPKNSISFSLDNTSGAWNPDNLTGNVKYLAEQQQLTVRYGLMLDDEIEWVDAGTFWLSEWTTSSNGLEVSFTARDMIEFMSDTYQGITSGTLYDIAISAFEQANLPLQENGEPRYLVTDDLKEWALDFPEDIGHHTLAEIVQLCANAACCVMYQDRQGVMRIEPLRKNSNNYAIKKSVSYSHPEFTFTKPLKAVSVNEGMGYAANSAVGETQVLDNQLINSETMANRVAEWVRKALAGRKTISGEYRADPTMDVFDKIAVESKYGVNNAVYITNIDYTYSGAFKGVYTGRITDFESEKWYSGELIAGEV